MIQLTNTEMGLIVAAAGKIFITIAETMPAPAPNSSLWLRWLYDWFQALASNSYKIGTTKDQIPGQPPAAAPAK